MLTNGSLYEDLQKLVDSGDTCAKWRDLPGEILEEILESIWGLPPTNPVWVKLARDHKEEILARTKASQASGKIREEEIEDEIARFIRDLKTYLTEHLRSKWNYKIKKNGGNQTSIAIADQGVEQAGGGAGKTAPVARIRQWEL